MRYDKGYKSDDVEDRREQQYSGGGGGGGGGGLSRGGINLLQMLYRQFGIPGVLVGGAVLFVASRFSAGGAGGSAPASKQQLQEQQPLVEFVSFVFDDAQKTWDARLSQSGTAYRRAHMVLFRGQTATRCGTGEAAMGPFYCSVDENVYIDLDFYDELKQKLGAPGDFAQAYVIAHEMGHHIQKLLGDSDRVHDAPPAQLRGDAGLSVRLELQADCYAGVWAHDTQRRDLLEAGDLDEAMNAASHIGDDTLQRQATGAVRPESFTHGSSAQRKRWLKRGIDSGDMAACDTFHAKEL